MYILSFFMLEDEIGFHEIEQKEMVSIFPNSLYRSIL